MADKEALERKLLQAAKAVLAEFKEDLPEGGWVSLAAWPNHLSATISRSTGDDCETVLHCWTDPTEEPMEVYR